jgi:hypothetical protein
MTEDEKNMKTNTSAFCSSVLLLIAGSVGCATAPDSVPEGEGTIVVDDMGGAWDLEGAVEMRVEREEGGELKLIGAPGWRKVAPGVWESPDANGTRMVVGEEGHRWLADEARGELNRLEERAAAAGTFDADLEEQIAAKQQELDAAHAGMASALAPPANLVSCNYAFYTGPSGAITDPPTPGAAAFAQVSCSGGCMNFTLTAQACCAGSCTPLVAQTKLVCATPWTWGVVRSGVYGSGYASVNVNPPNVTQTNASFYCQ